MRLEGKKNVYETLVAECKALIEANVWRCGEKLPSVRTLAMERKVNPNTVAKAYAKLEADGYIEVQLKKGAFVLARGETSKKNLDIVRCVQEWKARGVEKEEMYAVIESVYKESEGV